MKFNHENMKEMIKTTFNFIRNELFVIARTVLKKLDLKNIVLSLIAFYQDESTANQEITFVVSPHNMQELFTSGVD